MAKDILINNETGVMIIVDDIGEWREELEAGEYEYVGPAEEELCMANLEPGDS